LCSCEGFPNVPLMGTRGCLNYNPILALRQLGYPMRGASSKEIIAPFVARGFSGGNAKMVEGYHKWLKAWTQWITWLLKLKSPSEEEVEVPEEGEEVQALKVELERMRVVKEKLKTTVSRVGKECDKLRDVNITTAEALERETKRAQKEEWG